MVGREAALPAHKDVLVLRGEERRHGLHNLAHGSSETSQSSHTRTPGRRRRGLLPLPLAELTRPPSPFKRDAGWAAGCRHGSISGRAVGS